MVITGLTRNQVVLTGSWVRIPPLPPTKSRLYDGSFFISILILLQFDDTIIFIKYGDRVLYEESIVHHYNGAGDRIIGDHIYRQRRAKLRAVL